MNLVIVESPAKAKTINKYLGSDYKVLASYGHIRDLPSKDGSVLPDKDFETIYEVDYAAQKNVKAIADAVKKADTLLLATDPDREGEAISWHILEVLKQKKVLKKDLKIGRVVFHEITKNAIQEAIKNPRDIDMDLVNSQQARRVLDYLVGFNLSPVLWRKLPGSKSAGRVQSVALRLICERETEIEKFIRQEYWDIEVELAKKDGIKFTSRLTHLNGEKLEKFSLTDEAGSTKVAADLRGKNYSIVEVEKKQARRHPYAPFTTSTLQQEAARKLGFSAKKTMQIAQKLYEGVDIGSETAGLITYMRTDSVNVASEAIFGSRTVIEKEFGKDYLPEKPRFYQSKAKNAQEAHEAIRPTSPARIPDTIRRYLDSDAFNLYELVWKRLLASQMESAVYDQVVAEIKTSDNYAQLRANGSTLRFPGFLKLYREQDEDKKDDGDEDNRILPPLEKGEELDLAEVKPEQHFTEPPPRYSEASLVKKMEELGIGRPSTYASIISILQERDYVILDKKRFHPEERGRLVTAFLESFFRRYVEYDFTAKLEDELDDISEGKINWKEVLRLFWKDFAANVDSTKNLTITSVIEEIDKLLGPHFFPTEEARKCPVCNEGRLGIKLSKFGAFIGCSRYPDCNYTKKLDRDNKEVGEDGAPVIEFETIELGVDDEGNKITLRKGPYGFYVQVGEQKPKLKPKRAAVPKHMNPADVTLEKALALLSLPRDVGKHPESGKMIKAGLGRFGPYLQHDGKFKSLSPDDDVLSVGLNRAVAVLAEVKEGGRGGRASVAPIKTFKHPEEGEIQVLAGRYGPYVKYGKVNATIPKETAPEAVTLEQALELIENRAAKGGGKKKPARKAKKK